MAVDVSMLTPGSHTLGLCGSSPEVLMKIFIKKQLGMVAHILNPPKKPANDGDIKLKAEQWRIPLIPALGRHRQADLCEFKAILGYI